MMERIIGSKGRPVQQSMTLRPEDHVNLHVARPMHGLVLEVFPADNEQNRSSYQREDRRGYLATCTVLIINDGRGTYFTLENVVIPPTAPSGIDNFVEALPRPCTQLINGENWNQQLSHINPYTLDGDWCVVSFLGGSLDQPYISNWWPHPSNTFDPATSGQRNPRSSTEGTTLVQNGRLFRRMNGVEFVVTKEGNLYVSTHRANSTLKFGPELNPEEGRFPRNLQADSGGSIKVWVKNSQAFELDWNAPEDGMGSLDVAEAGLPQTNPSTAGSASRTEKEHTYILIEKDRVDITVPDEIKILSNKRILLESEEETILTVGSDLTIDVSGSGSISTDGNLDVSVTQNLSTTVSQNLDIDVTGQVTVAARTTLDLSATGATTISGATVAVGAAGASSGSPGSISVTSGGVNIGTGALGGAVGGDGLTLALTTFASAVAAAQASATVESTYAAALTAAAAALASAINAAISPTTRVG